MPRTKTTTESAAKLKRRPTRRALKAAAVVLPLAPQPVHLAPFRAGQDYQVAHPRLINGRTYRAGEILDQTGLSQKHIEMLRDQRIIVDIVAGGAPSIPIPAPEPDPAPLTAEQRAAMKKGDALDASPTGRVMPIYKGFGKWFVCDSRGVEVSRAFEGNTPKNDAQREANRINKANGHEVTEEEEMIASSQDDDDEG